MRAEDAASSGLSGGKEGVVIEGCEYPEWGMGGFRVFWCLRHLSLARGRTQDGSQKDLVSSGAQPPRTPAPARPALCIHSVSPLYRFAAPGLLLRQAHSSTTRSIAAGCLDEW